MLEDVIGRTSYQLQQARGRGNIPIGYRRIALHLADKASGHSKILSTHKLAADKHAGVDRAKRNQEVMAYT